MANESRNIYNKKQETEKLVSIYNDILSDKIEPSAQAQKKYLLQLLNTKISQLEPNVDRIKRINYGLKISAMLLSAISTVILGLKINGSNSMQWKDISTNTALIITSLVTFLTGLAIFWDTENYWIRNKIMLNKLKELRYEYVFYLEGNEKTDPGEMRSFLNKFLSALGDEYWEKFLKNISIDEKNEIIRKAPV